MNILKHMEAVFIATAVIAVSGVYADGILPEAHAAQVTTTASNGMTVIVVKAKRMSAEEKLKSVQAENTSAMARDMAGRA